MNNIAIIGAGASGLAAAIFIKQADKKQNVTLFDRMDRVGKKLLATGNGRCNLSNKNILQTASKSGLLLHYFGGDRQFAKPALTEFNVNALQDWFLSMNMPTIFEDDKLFPLSLCASTVLDILRFKCETLGVKFVLSKQIDKITKKNEAFIINGEAFDKVIVATGGKAQENLGSNGSGYELLCQFGHKLTKTMPAITQIKTETELVRQLKGLKINAKCTALVDSKPIRSEFGQLLFADYGLSGPPIFSLSRIASQYENRCKIMLDLLPDYLQTEIENLIKNTINKPYCPYLTLEGLLLPLFAKRIGQVIIKYCGFKLNMNAKELNQNDISKIANAIKNFTLKCTGVKGYNIAQVTAGGIDVADFDSKTMQSKLCKNLYAIGEVLDVDGDCGGYNLHFAFASANLASKSAVSGK